MINKNAQFNREKVPERVVHARGMTAKGFFEASAVCHMGLHLVCTLLPCGAARLQQQISGCATSAASLLWHDPVSEGCSVIAAAGHG